MDLKISSNLIKFTDLKKFINSEKDHEFDKWLKILKIPNIKKRRKKEKRNPKILKR